MLAHLLVTVYITPHGLSNYNLGAIRKSHATFRVGRFLTSLESMAAIQWRTVTIHFEVADEFFDFKGEIKNYIRQLFPAAQIHEFRLEYPSQWREAFSKYESSSLVLLNSNDDHAILPNGESGLRSLVETMNKNSSIEIGLVTHFSEFVGFLSRERIKAFFLRRQSLPPRQLMMDFSIGTILVRADLAKKWFEEGSLLEIGRIVRPDNPFGPSVTFSPTIAIVPTDEIFRHLDGYSHARLFQPIPPLRNVIDLDPQAKTFIRRPWKLGHWPEKLFAYHGSGADILWTTSESAAAGTKIGMAVARLRLHWGLRVDFGDLKTIRAQPSKISRLQLFVGTLVFFSSRVGLRNLADFVLLDFPALLVLSIGGIWSVKLRFARDRVWYLGTSRTVEDWFVRKRDKTSMSGASS